MSEAGHAIVAHAVVNARDSMVAPFAAHVGLQMFDNNPTAMLITRARQIERSNAAAAALLEARRPITLSAGRVRFEDSRAQAAFDALSRADQHDARRTYAFVVEGVDPGVEQLGLRGVEAGREVDRRLLDRDAPGPGRGERAELGRHGPGDGPGELLRGAGVRLVRGGGGGRFDPGEHRWGG